ALAVLAASALDVEGEAPGLVAAGLGLRQQGEELADGAPKTRVGRGIGPGRAPDGALIDDDHLVEVLEPLDRLVRAGRVLGLRELLRQRLVDDLVDEGRLAR